MVTSSVENERARERERQRVKTKRTFCCRLALCPQQQPLQIQLKAMHEIQMRRRAATLRFGCQSRVHTKAKCSYSRSHSHTRVSCCSKRNEATTQFCIYSPCAHSLALALSLALSCLRGPPQSGLSACVCARERRSATKTKLSTQFARGLFRRN